MCGVEGSEEDKRDFLVQPTLAFSVLVATGSTWKSVVCQCDPWDYTRITPPGFLTLLKIPQFSKALGK